MPLEPHASCCRATPTTVPNEVLTAPAAGRSRVRARRCAWSAPRCAHVRAASVLALRLQLRRDDLGVVDGALPRDNGAATGLRSLLERVAQRIEWRRTTPPVSAALNRRRAHAWSAEHPAASTSPAKVARRPRLRPRHSSVLSLLHGAGAAPAASLAPSCRRRSDSVSRQGMPGRRRRRRASMARFVGDRRDREGRAVARRWTHGQARMGRARANCRPDDGTNVAAVDCVAPAVRRHA